MSTSKSTRLPSLNQIAAHMNPASSAPSGLAAPRPRLAASFLRTGSNTSLSTAASTQDSVAVQPPETRSTSPSALTTSPPNEEDPSTPTSESGGDKLTKDKVERLNEISEAIDAATHDANPGANGEGGGVKKSKMPIGYKNVPSLEAITARLAKTRRTISVDGSAMPPEPPLVEDPKTPGVQMKPAEHPLQFGWTIYYDTKAKYPYTPASSLPSSSTPTAPGSAPGTGSADPNAPLSALHPPDTTEYEAGLTIVGEFKTVETFCRYLNWLKPPSQLEKQSNYHLFKSGIKPMWEDPANASGGKWVLTMRNNPTLLDRSWSWLAMALVGEELEEGDEICGAVVSLRGKVDRIQVWTRGKDDVEKLNAIGRRLVKLLDVSEADNIGLEFQYNSDDHPPPNKFITIQALPPTSYRSNFATGPGAPGAAAGGHAATRSMSQFGSGGS
ncbi:translation initiation factor eIF 4e-like domain-containing protein [Cyathus striatus]|nr:translation initiation factor eIF 4e-like domain-containing protein [Cyathus striatus]